MQPHAPSGLVLQIYSSPACSARLLQAVSSTGVDPPGTHSDPQTPTVQDDTLCTLAPQLPAAPWLQPTGHPNPQTQARGLLGPLHGLFPPPGTQVPGWPSRTLLRWPPWLCDLCLKLQPLCLPCITVLNAFASPGRALCCSVAVSHPACGQQRSIHFVHCSIPSTRHIDTQQICADPMVLPGSRPRSPLPPSWYLHTVGVMQWVKTTGQAGRC